MSNLTYPFGREQGKPLTEVPNKSLEFLIKTCTESLGNPEKAKFAARNKELIQAAKAVLIARLNGEAAPPAPPTPKPAPVIKHDDIQAYDMKKGEYTLREAAARHIAEQHAPKAAENELSIIRRDVAELKVLMKRVAGIVQTALGTTRAVSEFEQEGEEAPF